MNSFNNNNSGNSSVEDGKIIVDTIVKTYGKKENIVALNQISFEVNPGELFGIIGPDGSGKTTLLLPNPPEWFLLL